MVGLCGGLDSEKQSLGDVVVSSDVIYYEPGVFGPAGERQRFRISGVTPASILSLARELAHEPDAVFDRPVGIHIGSIASGEKLIESPNSFAENISNWSNVIAVDMEGAGVFEAAASTGREISVAIVRGIADFADLKKADDFRSAAATNAVEVAMELMRRLAAR